MTVISPEMFKAHKSEETVELALETNPENRSNEPTASGALIVSIGKPAQPRSVRLYNVTNGKVPRIAQHQLKEILDVVRDIGAPEASEIVLDALTTVFVRTFGPVLDQAIDTVVLRADPVSMAAFLANLGAVDDELTETARRAVLETYCTYSNPIVASGSQDGVDALDQWAERRANRRSAAERTTA